MNNFFLFSYELICLPCQEFSFGPVKVAIFEVSLFSQSQFLKDLKFKDYDFKDRLDSPK